MPRHPDFEEIYKSFIEQYGGKGEELYHRWLKKVSLDDTLPMASQGSREGFNWVGSAAPFRGALIKGRALHPVKTYHPEGWPGVRVYLEEELAASAPSLAGKPLYIDHYLQLPAPNRVLAAWYGDGAIEYVAEVDEEVAGLVAGGEITKCSVEFDWEVLERLNGVAPRGIEFTGLSLLRRLEPGDAETSVEVWEGIVEHIRGASEPPDEPSGGITAHAAPLAEGVLERNPSAEEGQASIFDDLLGFLPERVPMGAGYFAVRLVDRLRGRLLEFKERHERGELSFD